MKKTKELYSWKEYKCRNCQFLFAGSDLLRYPSQWGYDVRICHNCYKEMK